MSESRLKCEPAPAFQPHSGYPGPIPKTYPITLILRCPFDPDAALTLYWGMSDELEKTFSQELNRLERRLDELVTITGQLKDENRSLKQRQDTLISDRATMLQKNEQVRARVEAMVGRLKAMEHGS